MLDNIKDYTGVNIHVCFRLNVDGNPPSEVPLGFWPDKTLPSYFSKFSKKPIKLAFFVRGLFLVEEENARTLSR